MLPERNIPLDIKSENSRSKSTTLLLDLVLLSETVIAISRSSTVCHLGLSQRGL